MMRLAWFISPHGLGHAAREAALIVALRQRRPALEVELFTRVPSAFFKESGVGPFYYHDLDCDLGLVQRSPMEEDLPATLASLAGRLPFDPHLVRTLANALHARGCRGVVCDISPLGLAAAHAAGLPSLLVENFTWDWIYDGYREEAPGFDPFSRQMRDAFALADWHVQTTPVCHPQDAADTVGVVSRAARTPRDTIRRRLGLRPGIPAILVSGGVLTGNRTEAWPLLARATDLDFVLVGGREPPTQHAHVRFLPQQSEFYHPDLVRACDAVVAKLGYSTVAECYQAGTRLAYLTRPRFRESAVLAQFARAHMPSVPLAPETWGDEAWIDRLPALLAQATPPARPVNGADTLAELILERWG